MKNTPKPSQRDENIHARLKWEELLAAASDIGSSKADRGAALDELLARFGIAFPKEHNRDD